MVSRSRHNPRIVHEFYSVKYGPVDSMCLCGHRYGCALDAAMWIPAFAGMTWVSVGMAWVSVWEWRGSVWEWRGSVWEWRGSVWEWRG